MVYQLHLALRERGTDRDTCMD